MAANCAFLRNRPPSGMGRDESIVDTFGECVHYSMICGHVLLGASPLPVWYLSFCVCVKRDMNNAICVKCNASCFTQK